MRLPSRRKGSWALIGGLLLAGCPSAPTPDPRPAATSTSSPAGTSAVSTPTSAQPAASATAGAVAAASAAAVATGTASASAPVASASIASASAALPPPPAPKLTDDAGELLPQTKDQPTIDDALFRHRLDLLWRAIVADDPEIARPFFFPKIAYLKVKAIKDPGRDWERRLWKLFVRDIHEYHQKLGDHADQARFVRLDFPDDKVKWMKKHREGNAIGYFRVKRPYLVFAHPTGKEHKLEITAMISWRGHWHVVHLHGFK
jgi:hypothetical protein